jgi:hypothetical protein
VLLQYYKPENQRRVIEALCKAGRQDLIGHGADKLVKPDTIYLKEQRERQQKSGHHAGKGNGNGNNRNNHNNRNNQNSQRGRNAKSGNSKRRKA